MKGKEQTHATALLLLGASLVFFIMGFMFPLMQSGFGLGPLTFKTERVYMSNSFSFFFEQGEYFIGILLLLFTIIFPAVKYLFLFGTLLGKKIPKQGTIATLLEIINKWSMLDVFVVAVLLLNLKFDSTIIVSRLEAGTSLFALSVVLLMASSFIAKKNLAADSSI